MAATLITLSSLAIGALAAAEPAVTAAAMLPRQLTINPALVGYISGSSGYGNSRACDFPQVLSTSGSFAQCCPLSGACPFYTACSSNTLLAASGSAVPCDVEPGLTCNTAVLATTAGADGGASYLACWQATLGSSAFTFVQDIGSASVVAASMTGSSSSESSSASQASSTASSATSSTASESSDSSSSTRATASKSSSSASAASSETESASSSSSSASSTSGAGSTTNSLGFQSAAAGVVALLTCFLL